MELRTKDLYLNLKNPVIMGIINVTPDSFFENSKKSNLSKILNKIHKIIKEGASIIDIGGESTRPGAKEISVEEELNRVLPVIEEVIKRFNIFISIDTSKAEVMKEAAKLGAHIINDVRSLKDFNAIKVVKKYKLYVCLVHMQGNPYNMQKNPHYLNFLKEIQEFFNKKIKFCVKNRIKKSKLLIDPGFGFGKNLFHNYHMLANLEILNKFQLPIMVGISRKSMVSNLLNVSIEESLPGSLTGAIISVMKGAKILRVHDVKETFEAIKIINTVFLSKGYKK